MLAIAALALLGYRTVSEGHHYWAIQSLAFTLGLDSRTITRFNKFRQKRNLSDYERTGMVSEQEVKEMILFAKQLRNDVERWIQYNYLELLNPK